MHSFGSSAASDSGEVFDCAKKFTGRFVLRDMANALSWSRSIGRVFGERENRNNYVRLLGARHTGRRESDILANSRDRDTVVRHYYNVSCGVSLVC
jgi:hypothetical protein